MSDCLLSEAIIEEMRSRGFTGFKTDLVKSVANSSLGITYAQFRAIGWGGIAPKESGIMLTYKCKECLRMRYSAPQRPESLFNPTTWDGSDVFIIWPLANYMLVTRRVANFIRELSVSGIELVPLSQIDTGSDGFGPARLSHYFPTQRAQLIGRPLGID